MKGSKQTEYGDIQINQVILIYLKQKAKQLMKDNSANVVYFDTPFIVRVHDDVFMLGHVIIDTNDTDNYDDCDY